MAFLAWHYATFPVASLNIMLGMVHDQAWEIYFKKFPRVLGTAITMHG